MTKYKFILASASPRRKELLSAYINDFDIIPANIDENINIEVNKEEIPLLIAKNKAAKVMENVSSNSIIIAADTIVLMDNHIFGKPKNKTDAFNVLKTLSEKEHKVITGVCCYSMDKSINIEFSDTTIVTFSTLTNEMIESYLNENEYIDKAGAYALQGKASYFVTKINGSYDNVVGLPMGRLIRKLLKHNINIFQK